MNVYCNYGVAYSDADVYRREWYKFIYLILSHAATPGSRETPDPVGHCKAWRTYPQISLSSCFWTFVVDFLILEAICTFASCVSLVGHAYSCSFYRLLSPRRSTSERPDDVFVSESWKNVLAFPSVD